MAWPPPTLPTTRTDTTVMAGTHPADHNAANLAINDIVGWVKPTAWTTLPLVGGWVAEAPAGFALPEYRKIGDMVYLRGSIKSGAAGQFATIPVGFRPPTSLRMFYGGMDGGGVFSTVRGDFTATTGGMAVTIAPPVLFLNNICWSTV